MSANVTAENLARAPVVPLRPPRQWWVVRTAEGWKALSYRSKSRTPAIGPFASPHTAQVKIDELNGQERSRRQLLRTALTCAVIVAVVTAALMVAP